MTDKIQALRESSEASDDALFINAKTDAIWLSAGRDAEECFEDAVRRANAYGAAGADCLFVPGEFGLATITRLIESIHYPLNIVVKDGTPTLAAISKLNSSHHNAPGVRRVSMGSTPMRAALALVRAVGEEARSKGEFRTCLDRAIPYHEVMDMFVN